MKRTVLLCILVVGSIAFATQASALHLFFDAPSATNLEIDDEVTITYRLDTEGETQLTSLFVSTFVDPLVLEFVSGTSPGQILFNTSTFEGVARVSQPVDGVFGDDEGRVRAANFATATAAGSGVSSANQSVATLTFKAVGNGTVSIQALVVLGSDEVTVATVSVTDLVTTEDSDVITVPELNSAALALAALGTIGLIRRYSRSAAAWSATGE